MFQSDLAKRFVSLLSIDILVKVSSFLLLPIYLMVMTTEEFGLFSYGLSLAIGFSFVIGTGQHIVISRFYFSDEYSKKSIAQTILGTMFGSIIFYFLGSLFFLDELRTLFFKTSLTNFVFCFVLGLAVIQAFNQILMTYLYQTEDVKSVKYKSLIETVGTHGTALLLLYLIPGHAVEIRLGAISFWFVLIIAYYVYKKFTFKSFLLRDFSKPLFLRGLQNGIPVAIGSMSNLFLTLGDRFNIEKMLDTHHLGIYSLAITLCNILFILFNSFQGAWWPVVFKEKSIKRSLSRIHLAFLFFLGGSLVFTVAVFPVVKLMTTFGVDPRYLETLDFIGVLVFATFFQICSMLIGSIYEIYEKTYLGVILNLIFSATNLWLNTILIGQYGISGAAYSTLIISISLFLLNYLAIRVLVSFYKPKGFYE